MSHNKPVIKGATDKKILSLVMLINSNPDEWKGVAKHGINKKGSFLCLFLDGKIQGHIQKFEESGLYEVIGPDNEFTKKLKSLLLT